MLKLENITYAYDDLVAVNDVSLTIDEGEIVCLLGPSGCGKTTLLRVIAGLAKDYEGHVIFDGHDVADVAVHERDFGLMFQDFALFPHMNVADNIAYGLKRQSKSKNDRDSRVAEMLDRVGLEGFDDRDVNMLSGGQKQRVALARSLAPNPRLLMLDEPLGSLDALLREQLVVELRDIIHSVGLTSIYVTHDQKEAYAIADRVVVMNDGKIEQVDIPQQIYREPKSVFVARFLGLSNIEEIRDHTIIRRLIEMSSRNFATSSHLLIHPSGMTIIGDNGNNNIIPAKIQTIVFRGDYFQIRMHLQDDIYIAINTLQSHFEIGQSVNLYIKPDSIIPLD